MALAVAGVCLALALPWLELGVQSFIYFQF